MNISIGIHTSLKTRITGFIFAILFWIIKRYNKTNKAVNMWPRSEKDINTFGVTSSPRVYISRDKRIHVRLSTWSIYIGRPGTVN